MPVYFALDEENNRIKIGFTRKEPANRVSELEFEVGKKLKILGQILGAQQEEKKLHKQFQHLRIEGEWFRAESNLIVFIRENAIPAKSKSQIAEENRQARNNIKRNALIDHLLGEKFLPTDVAIEKALFFAKKHNMTYHQFLEALLNEYERQYFEEHEDEERPNWSKNK